EIRVERLESLEALGSLGSRRPWQSEPGVVALQALNHLAQIIGTFGEPLRCLARIGRAGRQRGHVELQPLRTQLEALESSPGRLETSPRQTACQGTDLSQQPRHEVAGLARR